MNYQKEIIRMQNKEERTISVRKVKYDIKGKANGEQKRYKLRCVFCNSEYIYNSMNPFFHWHTKKCLKVRKTPPRDSGDYDEMKADFETALANVSIRERTKLLRKTDLYHKDNASLYMLDGLGQKIIKIYYHTFGDKNEEEDIKRGYEVGKGRYSVRRIVYDYDYECELYKMQIKPFVDKISKWFLNIKYNPEYKYGRKHINSLYDENFD